MAPVRRVVVPGPGAAEVDVVNKAAGSDKAAATNPVPVLVVTVSAQNAVIANHTCAENDASITLVPSVGRR